MSAIVGTQRLFVLKRRQMEVEADDEADDDSTQGRRQDHIYHSHDSELQRHSKSMSLILTRIAI